MHLAYNNCSMSSQSSKTRQLPLLGPSPLLPLTPQSMVVGLCCETGPAKDTETCVLPEPSGLSVPNLLTFHSTNQGCRLTRTNEPLGSSTWSSHGYLKPYSPQPELTFSVLLSLRPPLRTSLHILADVPPNT